MIILKFKYYKLLFIIKVLQSHLKENGYRDYSTTKLSLEIQKLLPNDWSNEEKKKVSKIDWHGKRTSKTCIFGIKEIE